ncbi:MAG: hypothetical protein Q4C47_09070, partial [Planctomycetia bacterium]|nr:hypothetical protein [Planctomycetia bacterium]
MNLLILTIDRWGWAFAEPLGNRWIRTPVLNRLATMGTVFGQCYATSSDPMATWRSLMTGVHPLRMSTESDRSDVSADVVPPGNSLPGELLHRGWRCQLLTDSESLFRMSEPESWFDTIEPCEIPRPEIRCAETIEQTDLFRSFSCFHETLCALSDKDPIRPFLLAVHLESLGRTWDAPFRFRAGYVEGDDPEPSDSAMVPYRTITPDVDSDELLAVRQ